MEREIIKRLEVWKSQNHKKLLIIKGSPQVGKTYAIREFAKRNYKSFIEINFERDMEYVDLFNKTRKPADILSYLQLSFLDVEFNQETLFFMDEIQACSTALTTLKFLSEDFPCDIICSGSMLGVAIASTSSFPVGYVETWNMYPMSFKEFLKALGVKDDMITMMQECLRTRKPIPDVLHDKLNDFYTSYIIVGGMPEVVSTYIQTKSYRDSLLVQRRIVNDYLNDMAKYAQGSDRIKARECFESIPIQLSKENKKFQYKLVKEGGSARHYESSLRWLADSGMIIPVYRLKTIDKPLEVYKELSIFKVYFCDTGLFISQFDESIIKELLKGKLGLFKGAIYENIAAQTLRYMNKECYYFEPNTTSEIDFIIYYEGHIVPLEVKAGKNTRSISFNHFVEKYNSQIAIRFSKKNISVKDNILYLPLYLLEFVLELEDRII